MNGCKLRLGAATRSDIFVFIWSWESYFYQGIVRELWRFTSVAAIRQERISSSLVKFSSLLAMVWKIVGRWHSQSQVCENVRENESVTSKWLSIFLFSFSLYAIPKATNVTYMRKLLSAVNSQILKKAIHNFSLSLFQVHGLWRDNANAEGDDTDEPAMSPASPPGTTIWFEIKTLSKHIWPIRSLSLYKIKLDSGA